MDGGERFLPASGLKVEGAKAQVRVARLGCHFTVVSWNKHLFSDFTEESVLECAPLTRALTVD